MPEIVLNVMTLAGGFPGAWVGRFLFRHKTNLREHSTMFAILVAATLLHGGRCVYLWWRFLAHSPPTLPTLTAFRNRLESHVATAQPGSPVPPGGFLTSTLTGEAQ